MNQSSNKMGSCCSSTAKHTPLNLRLRVWIMLSVFLYHTFSFNFPQSFFKGVCKVIIFSIIICVALQKGPNQDVFRLSPKINKKYILAATIAMIDNNIYMWCDIRSHAVMHYYIRLQTSWGWSKAEKCCLQSATQDKWSTWKNRFRNAFLSPLLNNTQI